MAMTTEFSFSLNAGVSLLSVSMFVVSMEGAAMRDSVFCFRNCVLPTFRVLFLAWATGVLVQVRRLAFKPRFLPDSDIVFVGAFEATCVLGVHMATWLSEERTVALRLAALALLLSLAGVW